jgi:predicted membrane channel-forming protein YqfA (hemolysin III family)
MLLFVLKLAAVAVVSTYLWYAWQTWVAGRALHRSLLLSPRKQYNPILLVRHRYTVRRMGHVMIIIFLAGMVIDFFARTTSGKNMNPTLLRVHLTAITGLVILYFVTRFPLNGQNSKKWHRVMAYIKYGDALVAASTGAMMLFLLPS